MLKWIKSWFTVYRDRSLELVEEFHRAFDCYVAPLPHVPDPGSTGRHRLVTTASQMRELSVHLRMAAEVQQRIGDTEGGLLLIRLQLAQEELAELAEAMALKDIRGCLDALVDIDYVNTGTYLTLGLGPYRAAALEEVHRSNMSKLDKNGKPIIAPSGRVVKGPNYFRPDLQRVLDLGE